MSTTEEEEFRAVWCSSIQNTENHYVSEISDIYSKIFQYSKNGTDFSEQIESFLELSPEPNEIFGRLEKLENFSSQKQLELKENIISFDSYHNTNLVSSLLPRMYSKKFYNDQTLYLIIKIMSKKLAPHKRRKRELDFHSTEVSQEITRFKENVQLCPENVRKKLVSHRGFHNVNDDTSRPLENTLQSMEQAWLNGVPYCECDISLSSDGEIFLAHDFDFTRLALFPDSESAKKDFNDLSFSELVGITLKNGVRAPSLKDILEIACQLKSHLVIEVKHGSSGIGKSLAIFFSTYPRLLSGVAIVMSFDEIELSSFNSSFFEIQKQRELSGESLLLVPKILLLTHNIGTAYFSYEAQVDITNKETILVLINKSPYLHGLYLRYSPEMLTTGKDFLISLCEKYVIGVWGVNPDNIDSLSAISDLGVHYINSDFPNSFAKKTKK
eukprot:c11095_g1_i1.p1 GENE.c11095_g1_i1~~c11095_g1_i1.p1  ORF type:complete len:441 (+),score=129.73 c11095_g1_i1:1-1323(+)